MVAQLGIEPMTTRCLVVVLTTKLLGRLGFFWSSRPEHNQKPEAHRQTPPISIARSFQHAEKNLRFPPGAQSTALWPLAVWLGGVVGWRPEATGAKPRNALARPGLACINETELHLNLVEIRPAGSQAKFSTGGAI